MTAVRNLIDVMRAVDVEALTSLANISSVQEQLVSGASIKTINNTSLLGAGDITLGDTPFRDDGAVTTELVIQENSPPISAQPSGTSLLITLPTAATFDYKSQWLYLKKTTAGTCALTFSRTIKWISSPPPSFGQDDAVLIKLTSVGTLWLGYCDVLLAPTGQVLYESSSYGDATSSTFEFVVPSGVTKIHAVAVGAGGSGASCTSSYAGRGGNGGALSYSNDIPVTEGETLTVLCGNGGNATLSSSFTVNVIGGGSGVKRGGTWLIFANGGDDLNSPIGDVTQAGGAGGAYNTSYGGGGGGAGGYSGSGGNGGSGGSNLTGANGTGGAGAGGSSGTSSVGADGGGGVGLFGAGTSGSGSAANPGTGGSGGATGAQNASYTGGNGGAYGGGGGGSDDYTTGVLGGHGGLGAVRILWGSGRAFPSTNVGDV